MQYIVASDLDAAVRIKRDTRFTVLAGGTDIYPAIECGLRVQGLIDVSRIAAMKGKIALHDGFWTIPALTTWSEVAEARLPAQFDLLKQAATEIGGRQIQNTATVGGNLCNASPAADGIAALLTLDARVLLVGSEGQRELPLERFVLGNRRTALGPDEILYAIRVPDRTARHATAFRKHGARRYLVISIAMVGTLLEVDAEGTVQHAAISVGACAARAVRLPLWERALVGRKLAEVHQATIPPSALAPLQPIDDIRGTAQYRLHAAEMLVREALKEVTTRLI
jgi:CO/xanthine dehydrogenase FAD-binding subunit